MISQTLTGQLAVVFTLGIGALLIDMFALLRKESHYFATFSLIVGVLVWALLLWFTVGNPVIRYQISTMDYIDGGART